MSITALRSAKPALILATAVAVGLFAVACGPLPYNPSSKASTQVSAVNADGTTTQPGWATPAQYTGAATDNSGADTSGNTSTAINLVAPTELRVGTIGYNAFTVKVMTNTTLIVRFTPGTQDQTISGTNVSPAYSGLGVYIKVGNMEVATPLLSNGLVSAPQSKTIDFSTGFTKTCASSDTACRQSVTITVYKPNYDYWCFNGYYNYCPWTQVWSTHPWHGTLEVQTDDTTALE